MVCSLRLALLSALCGLLNSCVGLSKRDAFPVAGRELGSAEVRALAPAESDVRPLAIASGGHRLSAYYVQHAGAKGVLIFFGGSGNQVDAALETLSPRTASLGLNLVVFSYYQAGEEIPSVTQVRAEGKAVYAAVRATHTPASKAVYLMGHSLGGWFALDVAASEEVRGLVLVGAETTSAEVIRKTDAPWASLVAIRPDDDAKQLDAALYAPRVRAKTLVVTSRQDEAVPASVGTEVFQMIPAGTPKRLLVLAGVTHGRYFLSDELWKTFSQYYRLADRSDPRVKVSP